MRARLVKEEQLDVGNDASTEIFVWEVPVPVKGSRHSYKYSLTLVVGEVAVLRYDNEAGKGDHWHLGRREFPYDFRSVDDLVVDFWIEVEKWLKHRGK